MKERIAERKVETILAYARRTFGGFEPDEFRPSRPSVSYSIDDWGYEQHGNELIHDLHGKGLEAFRHCTSTDEHVFVVDPYHDAFRVWPHNTRELWFFENGETVLTLGSDYRFGTYSTFWRDDGDVFCIFGGDLIAAFLAHPPALLAEPVCRMR